MALLRFFTAQPGTVPRGTHFFPLAALSRSQPEPVTGYSHAGLGNGLRLQGLFAVNAHQQVYDPAAAYVLGSIAAMVENGLGILRGPGGLWRG
jgi:hypothetical protein